MFEVTSSMQGGRKKKNNPIAFTRLVELLKQPSLSARLKTGTSSMFKHCPIVEIKIWTIHPKKNKQRY